MTSDLSPHQEPFERKQALPSLFRAVKVTCNGCGSKFRLADRYAGRRLKCRKCGEVIFAPHDAMLVERPAEPTPSPLAVLLKRLKILLTGDSGRKRLRRVKWLSERQHRLARALFILTVAGLGVAATVMFFRSEAASIIFGTQAGKEIAFRGLVELEERLATTLRDCRDASDVPQAVETIDSIRSDQLALWETVAEWKLDGDLTAGELNLLRTRYRKAFEAASDATLKEQLRIAKDPALSRDVLAALGRGSEERSTARQLALGGSRL